MDAYTPPVEPRVQALAGVVRKMSDAGFVPEKISDLSPGLAQWSGNRSLLNLTLTRRFMVATTAVGVSAAAGLTWWAARRGPMQSSLPIDMSAVALLPFDNDTGEQSLSFLSRSVPDELGRLMTNLTSFIIRPFSEVQHVLTAPARDADPGRVLGVGHLVTGSFSRSGAALNLDISIADVARQQQIWTDTFQAAPTALTGLMEMAVSKVANVLQVQLDAEKIKSSIGSQNNDAYGLYLEAISFEQEVNEANNKAAIADLERATALDPQFARAYAALAEAEVTRFYWNLSDETDLLDKAESAAKKAIALSPNLAESHFALAYTYEGRGLRRDAVEEYFKSFRANAHYAGAVEAVARYLFYMGAFDHSIAGWNAFAKIEPTSNKANLRKAMCYFFMGDRGRSHAQNAKAEKLAQGVDELTLVAFTYAWLHDFPAAQRLLVRLEHEAPGAAQLDEVRTWISVEQGSTQDARAHMAMVAKENGDRYGILDELATWHAILGDVDQAASLLARAVKAGAPNLAWYRSDFFKLVRGNAQYQATIAQLEGEYALLKREIAEIKL
jgi:tetratricopeptide (TPR) repeat protein